MKRELVPLPDLRHEIHELTVQKHSSGLSPPEEDILERLEVQELYMELSLMILSDHFETTLFFEYVAKR